MSCVGVFGETNKNSCAAVCGAMDWLHAAKSNLASRKVS
ncbi:hypothetical protein BMETH_324_0 [methanotrophic bacterial endosymbiont of Bathymodiolus sp.]|nr:hypothetical protein BMETH_324_0 [methanotrophic bacterial endosymbiont of Bathymodiolus sp.]